MKKFLEFIISHPKLVIITIIAVTLINAYGITLFEYDNSEKNAMPASDKTFQLGEDAKKEFGDSSTFLIAAIEPAPGKKIMSPEIFRHINDLVTEIEEYRKFDIEKEDNRLKLLLDLSGVKIAGSVKRTAKEISKDSIYEHPHRERNIYDYSSYRPVSAGAISDTLDPAGKAMFYTVLAYNKIQDGSPQKTFSDDEFRLILESWEDLYLYKSIQIFQETTDPITLSDINGENDTLRSSPILNKNSDGKRILPEKPEDFDQIIRKLKGNPSFESNFYSTDANGEICALSVTMTLKRQPNYSQFTDYLWTIFQKYNHDPVVIHLQGGLIFDKFINEYNSRDMTKYLPVMFLIMLILYYLNFKSIRGVVLPILAISIGSIWTMGLLGYMGIKMTVLTSIIPPLIMAIGSAYSIHIINQYYIDLEYINQEGKKSGLLNAMLHIVNTIFITGLATFISFLTLTTNDVKALTEFGIGISLGTVIIIIISLSMVPAALSILKLPPVKHQNDKEQIGSSYNGMVLKAIGFMSKLSIEHYGKVIIVVIITVIISIAGITRIKTETSATSYFKPDSYIRKSLDRTNELFNGSYVTNIVLSPGPGKSILDADFLKYIDEVQQWLKTPENRTKYHILHNSGFNEYVKRMNKAMNNEDPAFYTIPDSMTINDYLEIFSGDDANNNGRPDILEPTMSSDRNKTVIYVRMGTLKGELMSTSKIDTTLRHVREYLDSKPNPNGYTYYITGGTINFVILSKYINDAQIQGILSGIISIGVIMFLLFRNIETGLVVLVPMIASVLWIFGFMGWAGIPFGMTEAVISPIAIGIGIDDACHILNTLRKKSFHGLPLEQSISETHHETGLAIVYTSLANSLGAAVLTFSSFIPVFRCGLLVCAVLIISTLSNLVLFPSVIMFFRIDVCKIKDWKIFKFIPLHRLLID